MIADPRLLKLRLATETMQLSQDGSRLLVLDKLRKPMMGYPAGISILTIIDTAAAKIVSRTEIGWTCADYDLADTGLFDNRFSIG